MENMQYFETGSTDPAYNLAFEEYILTHFRTGHILILWQNDNAVIIGRNQNAEEEIHKGFVDAHGIKVVRRNTGGGAVYHDLGNLNYSFITDAQAVDSQATKTFLQPVIAALKALDLDAEFSGRNDILISGKKISGTAQQFSHGRLLLHGTLLFDSDPNIICGALNPDPAKFQSKSIKSVRSRVGSIREHLNTDMDMQQFWSYLKSQLLSRDCTRPALCAEDLDRIRQLKLEKYDTWQWNYGRSPKYNTQRRSRWPGGLLDIRMEVSGGIIAKIRIFGDFLSQEPVDILEAALTGCELHKNALENALTDIPLSLCIGSVTADELIKTVLGDF